MSYIDYQDYITECIKNNTPVVYCKYGDGEYFCATKYVKNIQMTENCDNDTYTIKLSNNINKSFKYIVENSNNCLIGRWFSQETLDYWQNLTETPIKWADYHTLLFEPDDIKNDERFNNKIKIFKAIKESKRLKIYICNPLLIKVQILLDIDNIVLIPLNNWFDTQFDEILNKVKEIIGNYEFILMTSCGQSAKVLIAELHKIYPNGIYLDVGSGLDCICTKRESRGWGYKYDEVYDAFKRNNFLPNNWDDPKYDNIYEEAHNKLGTHLPK
jgi:hypothetical protein